MGEPDAKTDHVSDDTYLGAVFLLGNELRVPAVIGSVTDREIIGAASPVKVALVASEGSQVRYAPDTVCVEVNMPL